MCVFVVRTLLTEANFLFTAFNMLTMQKEKVNTHFSFPMKLDMSAFVEKTLMPQQYNDDKQKRAEIAAAATVASTDNETSPSEALISEASTSTATPKPPVAAVVNSEEDEKFAEHYEYKLIGVTVHTGTADGGHYYSFIKERSNPNSQQQDRWFLFNDAEVKQFDPSQIDAECFGGEMTSKTYDSVTEKYLDFSFEKTNSAYMLFYERCLEHKDDDQPVSRVSESKGGDDQVPSCSTTTTTTDESPSTIAAPTLTTTTQSTVDDDEIKSMVADAVRLHLSTPANSKQPEETESNSDLAIGQNKCDIDVNKSDSSCNSIGNAAVATTSATDDKSVVPQRTVTPENVLSQELEEWIWDDNRAFLKDRNIFEHTYFSFMWQICGQIPQTLFMQGDVTCMAAQLSVSFFIETFIHAKEKVSNLNSFIDYSVIRWVELSPYILIICFQFAFRFSTRPQPTMVLWVELLTKQFNANQEACEWFLSHMSTELWWPVHILIKCPNQMVRQMFQRLVIHVIQRLRQSHYTLYLKTDSDNDGKEIVGEASCVTKFIKSLITIMEHGAKAHLRHLSEFFGLLYDFSRMGEEETLFLLKINVIRSVADFYLGHKPQNECVSINKRN